MKFIKKLDKKKRLLLLGCLALTIVVIVTIILLVVGNAKSNSIEGLTKSYMSKYQKLDKEVVNKIKYEFDDKLTPEQKQKYRSIIENQYEESQPAYHGYHISPEDGGFEKIDINRLKLFQNNIPD